MAQEAATKTKPETEILVNKKAVRVSGHRVTGLEVKEAAIAFGVQIELNFQLAVLKGKKRDIVGDDDVVSVETDTQFFATAPDDNS